MEKFLSRSEVAKHLHISETTLWRWVRAGHFPKPVRLGANTVGFAETAVDDWINAKKLASGGVV